jgi:hypothetical protein
MRRRHWRVIGVAIVALIGLFLALDVVLVKYLESRGSAELARTMSAENADIDLGGFPFFFRFMRGKLTDVSVDVSGSSASGGLRVDSISARMLEVTFKPGEIFALARSSFSTRTKVSAKEPFAIVELVEQDLEDFIRRTVPQVGDVQIKGSGVEVRFIRSGADLNEGEDPADEDMTKPARYLPDVENGKLVMRLISVSQIESGFRSDAARLEGIINLPRIPAGLKPDVSLRDKAIVMEAQGLETSITIGEGEPG